MAVTEMTGVDWIGAARDRLAAAGVTDILFPWRDWTLPAWLNLDAMVPPDTREEIVGLIIEGTELEATVRDFAQRVHARSIEFELDDRPLTDGSRTWTSLEDVYELVQYLTGGSALHQLLSNIIGHLEAAANASDEPMSIGTPPDWSKQEQREELA